MDNNIRPNLADRKANPFGVKKRNNDLTLRKKDQYEDLNKRTELAFDVESEEAVGSFKNVASLIAQAIKKLKERTKGKTFSQEDFGEVYKIPLSDLLINIMNQRAVDWLHIAYIVMMFDPRIVQVINVVKLPNGKYSVPEGQHTAVALWILMKLGMIPENFMVYCKVVEHELMVPGSPLKGEGFGNLLFRIINYKGRKSVDPYYLHRSRYNGVEMYNSELQEDLHAYEIQQVLIKNNMFPAPAIEARGQGATPGMVTYLNGLYNIAEHDTENFDEAINDLDWALGCHDERFNGEKGVDGGFILAFGRYAKQARKDEVTITQSHRKTLLDFFEERYSSPKAYHKECKKRLKTFQRENVLNEQWSDKCLCPILIKDFDDWNTENEESYPMLEDKNINVYGQGI